MSVDEIVLLGRIAFVAALYVFLFLLALLLRRELRGSVATAEERAPCDLLVVEPHETDYEPGERIPLLAQTSIGRGADNALVLNDTFVSTQHARLTWNGKGWVVEDLGSTNGTTVNDHTVKRAMPIKPGDTVQFGRVKMKLVPV